MCLNESYSTVREDKTILTHGRLRMFKKKETLYHHCFTLRCKICNKKGSGRIGEVEMKQYLAVSGLR
jgi:hypothetical protein